MAVKRIFTAYADGSANIIAKAVATRTAARLVLRGCWRLGRPGAEVTITVFLSARVTKLISTAACDVVTSGSLFNHIFAIRALPESQRGLEEF